MLNLYKSRMLLAVSIIFIITGAILVYNFDTLTKYPIHGSSSSLHAVGSSYVPSFWSSKPKYAIATFVSGQNTEDLYYNATRLLTYQLLHEPSTRLTSPDIAWVVLCGKKLPKKKQDRLRQDGAMVIEIEDVPLPHWYPTDLGRWSEVFTKLRVFELTQFERLLFIDADSLIMHPIDAIFDEPEFQTLTPNLAYSEFHPAKEDEGLLPKEWLFASRPEIGLQGAWDHPVPPVQGSYFNAGFFMVYPDKDMYEYLFRVMQFEGRFKTEYPEQDMLNYAFRHDGPMPWREINWKWNGNFVNQADIDAGMMTLHCHFWNQGPEVTQKKWAKLIKEMLRFYETD
jgi:alpha-N-acetylglucosamine transferase